MSPQLLVCVGALNPLNRNTYTIKKNRTKINFENSKYLFMSHHQNARQRCNMKIANFVNITMFEYLGMTVTTENLIHEQVKSILPL
jgi:hypothetical protein